MAKSDDSQEKIAKDLMSEVSKRLNLYSSRGLFSNPVVHDNDRLEFTVPGTFDSLASIEVQEQGYGEITELDGNRYKVLSVCVVASTPAIYGVNPKATQMFHEMSQAVEAANKKSAGLVKTLVRSAETIKKETNQITLVQIIASIHSSGKAPWTGKAPEGVFNTKVEYLGEDYECTVENGKLTIKEVD